MKNDKITKRLSLIGIILIVAVIIIASILKLDPKIMATLIIFIWAAVIIIRMYAVNGKNKEYNRMLDHLNKILTVENDPEKYVQKCMDYSRKAEDEGFKAMLKMNSAVGYSCMCRYEEAVDVLKSTDLSLLNPGHKAVALNNLAQYLYILDRNDEATECIGDNFQTLHKYLESKSFAASFTATFSFYYYFKGNKNKAEKYTKSVLEFIENSGSTSQGDMRLKEKLTELLEKIKEMPNPEDECDD